LLRVPAEVVVAVPEPLLRVLDPEQLATRAFSE
jgi:hypothetical protein